MAKWQLKNIRSLNIAAHRDFGYFFSTLIIVYCLSGLALNHIDEWNPDFVITKDTIQVSASYTKQNLNNSIIDELGKLVGETNYKVFDTPTNDQVKIYYNNASFHINFTSHTGIYEKVARRALFYHSNILHRNSVKGWKWISDVFAIMLIILNITGVFILRGKYGISGRGKWLITAGMLPPIIAIIIHELT